MTVVTLESASYINMIIDKKEWRLPKPISNRPGYDMEYYRTYLANYYVNEIKPTKSYHHGWHRFIELIEIKDMMQEHWDQECSDPLSDLRRARVKQQAFNKFKENDLIGIYCNKLQPPLKYWDSIRNETHSLTPPNKLFISFQYAKQNNLLPPINHLNQPKDILRKGQMVINPETQEEYVITCKEFYAYFKKHYSKYIGIINPVKLTSPYEEYVYCSSSKWIEVKKYQLE
ncbi:hypothetical protein GLOIN_2v1770884 [Rhizophagus irregularis DAOM 181602=DAOM 197198]|uniref:Uncharacterized protein n=1 Tax=Rhizophagus irregularis (strain DAOM 181602 / DAOM 197198 / MUCL 43194) TaxID=747089 RepID=A0A2P4QB15_RHIID|nr:hypothetical protein GLOIN_2v1770884 [Rhizophagus irregularis DAOM 181602=DAOM 197198]POG74834.1 hypothetical protein GLOIN_2v1770884 [Rhizophagus irregularis DAOM 181602=DAOM 197198]|eukprot:XP_025181700.1 hypothetical protein GLOIN_2v1770884 [Rhizophagus irregularis DAOM 181602=DAOM 197198]